MRGRRDQCGRPGPDGGAISAAAAGASDEAEGQERGDVRRRGRGRGRWGRRRARRRGGRSRGTSCRMPERGKRRPASREVTGPSKPGAGPGPESDPSPLPTTGQKKDPTGRNKLRPRRERGPAARVESAQSKKKTKRPDRRGRWRR